MMQKTTTLVAWCFDDELFNWTLGSLVEKYKNST